MRTESSVGDKDLMNWMRHWDDLNDWRKQGRNYNNLSRYRSNTRHENFHGKFSLCAECLIRLIGQKLTCMLKVFTDYSEVFI